MKKEIEIPREWIERLIELNENCKGMQTKEVRKESLMLLHGFIESAKYIISKSNSSK